jgi:predicted permease
MDATFLDLRYSARQLRNSPGFTVTAALTLAIGIAALTTVFTWIKAVLYDPWPHVAKPGGIRFIDATESQGQGYSVHFDQFRYLAQQKNVFGDAIAFDLRKIDMAAPSARPEALTAGLVTSNYFQFLGLKPQLGEFFNPSADDHAYGSQNSVVLSDALWRSRFAADPGVVGSRIFVNGRPFTVVGVAPRNFFGIYGGMAESAWVPCSALRELNAAASADPLNNYGFMVGVRLARGVADERAKAALHVLARRFAAEQHSDRYNGWDLNLRDAAHFERGLFGSVGEGMPLLIGASGLLFLLVCMNVAALLGQRTLRRQREMAVRLALGAARIIIARQIFIEVLLVAALGCAIGAYLSGALARSIYSLLPNFGFTLKFNLQPDGRILGFVVALIAIVTLLCGTVPALQSMHFSQNESLHQGGRSIIGARSRRAMTALLSAQLAISFVLLVCCALFVRTVLNVLHAPLGFDKSNCLVASIDLSRAGYETQRGFAFDKGLMTALSVSPGVAGVTLTTHTPMGDWGSGHTWEIAIPGYQPAKGEQMSVVTDLEGPNFFRTFRIPIRSGREFTMLDDSNAPPVAVINETMAHRYWPRASALGKTIVIAKDSKPAEIVGVVADYVYQHAEDTEREPLLFLPLLQRYSGSGFVVLRSKTTAYGVLPQLRKTIHKLDPALPLENISSMDEVADQAYRFVEIPAELLAVYASASLLVAMMGIYAVTAYAVTERTRELALRLALGARREQIRTLILSSGLRTAAIGLGIGAVGAFYAVRVIKSILFGVAPLDPLSFGAAGAVVLLTTLIAAFLPARRAAAADPMDALRTE